MKIHRHLLHGHIVNAYTHAHTSTNTQPLMKNRIAVYASVNNTPQPVRIESMKTTVESLAEAGESSKQYEKKMCAHTATIKSLTQRTVMSTMAKGKH